MEYIEPKPVEVNPHAKRNKIIILSSVIGALVAGIALTYYFTISKIFVEKDHIDLYTFSYRYDDENAGVRIDSVKESATLPANFRIPNKLNGRPVVEIASGVFKNRTELKKVHLPEQLKIIGSECFYGCENLESFNVPSTVTSIGTEAFEETKWLNDQDDGEVVLGSMLYTYKGIMEYPAYVIKSEDYMPDNDSGTIVDLGKYVNMSSGVFKGQYNLISAQIPDNFPAVYESTFEGCDSLEAVELPNTLESINDYAFAGCSSLTEINLPEDLKNIGNYAFSDSMITGEFNFSENLEFVGAGAFRNCKEITKVSIPTGFEYLSDNLFSGCEKLADVNFGNAELTTSSTISYIGENAFENTALKEFHVPFNVASIKKNAFIDCEELERVYIYNNKIANHMNAFVIDEETGESSWEELSNYQGLLKLETKVFNGDTKLEGIVLVNDKNEVQTALNEVSFPVTLSSVGGANEDALMFKGTNVHTIHLGADLSGITDEKYLEFVKAQDITILPPTFCEGAQNLKNVDFGGDNSTITTINRAAFKDCVALENITIANTVKTIETNVFQGCTSLKSVTLSNICEAITAQMFEGCTSLESIEIPSSYKTIGLEAFSGCESLKTVDLGANPTLTNIGRNAFAGCKALTGFSIPNTCDAMADGIFRDTDSLVTVSLSENNLLTEIKASTFENSGITYISLPENYTHIGDNAFKGSDLTYITLNAKSVVSLGNDVFADVDTLEHIYVPTDLVDAYKAAPQYSSFASIIEAIA